MPAVRRTKLMELFWRDVVARDPGYPVYQQRTSRRIPVVVLEPERG
jgi:hypothetical protein